MSEQAPPRPRAPADGRALAEYLRKERFVAQHTSVTRAGGLEPAPGERTIDVTQAQIRAAAARDDCALATRSRLHFGGYQSRYSLDGRFRLCFSDRGHAALFDELRGSAALAQTHLPGAAVDAVFGYSHAMLALASPDAVRLFDESFRVLAALDAERNVSRLEFLPFHMLLVSASAESARLWWRDVALERVVAERAVPQLSPRAVAQNPHNAVVYTGSTRGVAQLWVPRLKQPAMSFAAADAELLALAALQQHYLVSATRRNDVLIHDIRNAQRPVARVKLNSRGPVHLAVSQTNVLAVAQHARVTTWREPANAAPLQPYLRHAYNDGSRVLSLAFQPYRDVLSVGLSDGVEQLLIPGAGFAQLDFRDRNPYLTVRQRAEAYRAAVAEKLPADFIMIDPSQFGEQ